MSEAIHGTNPTPDSFGKPVAPGDCGHKTYQTKRSRKGCSQLGRVTNVGLQQLEEIGKCRRLLEGRWQSLRQVDHLLSARRIECGRKMHDGHLPNEAGDSP